jgi:hypothetical protein
MGKMGIGLVLCALILTGSVGSAAEESSEVRYVIYLHGWIIQDQQDPRPKHPQFGFYELEEILDTFRKQGFTVSGKIRPKSASIDESADQVVVQIENLLESGVPASRVTVVGASMGAAIALLASERLGNTDIRFAVLGACLSTSFNRILEQEGTGPTGHVLSIREASDRVTGSCPPLTNDLKLQPSQDFREIVLETGLDHGFLYRPISEWVDPVLEWLMAGE